MSSQALRRHGGTLHGYQEVKETNQRRLCDSNSATFRKRPNYGDRKRLGGGLGLEGGRKE